jgi:hypothetical protein
VKGELVYFRSWLSALFALSASAFSAVAQNTASIQGTIVDDSTGKPVPGAVVMASRNSPPAVRRTATSSFDGTFQISALAAGAYDLCAQMPTTLDSYLSTCHWGSAPTAVAAAGGQKSTGITLRMKAASVVKIHIDDAGKFLNQKNKNGFYPDLLMGVWSGGMFYPAHPANKGAVASDYQVAVPFDAALKFSIQSRGLALGDAHKNPLPNNADQQAFQHAANVNAAARPSFSYSILAIKP